MKNFELAIDEYESVEEEDDKILEFTLPLYTRDEETGEILTTGTKVYETYLPTETQIALYVGGLGAARSDKQLAAVIQFMDSCFLPDSRALLRERMEDRRDPIGLQVMQDIIQWVVEEVSANPSTGSATSTPSRQPSGSASKATSRPKAQTRSRGARAGS